METPRTFQDVKKIMEEPIRPPDPYTDAEIECLMWQPPLPEETLNDILRLSAEQENEPNQNQLELQLP